jgi:hypothetical protein
MRLATAGVTLVTVAASVWGLGFLSHHERLVINDVHVQGVEVMSPDVVKAAFEAKLNEGTDRLFSSANMFLYSRRAIEEGILKAFPRLKEVSVTRESLMAQVAQVAVEERKARFRWCKEFACYFMDETGFVFAPVDTVTKVATPYVFRGALIPNQEPIGQMFLRGKLENVEDIFSELTLAGFTPDGAEIENDTDMRVPLVKGFYLKVAFNSDPHDVAENLRLITASEALQGKLGQLEYVDLRFGNRVYYQLQ